MGTFPGPPRPRWRKSSHSGGGNNTCVELASLGGEGVGIRDSKDPNGPRLNISREAFGSLLIAIKSG